MKKSLMSDMRFVKQKKQSASAWAKISRRITGRKGQKTSKKKLRLLCEAKSTKERIQKA